MAAQGWFTKYETRRSGLIWVFHWRRIKPETGKPAETTCNIGPVAQFPREKDAWAEVERRHLIPNSGQALLGRITVNELVANYRKKDFNKLRITTQTITNHILDDYLLPRWGDSFALDIDPDDIEAHLAAFDIKRDPV